MKTTHSAWDRKKREYQGVAKNKFVCKINIYIKKLETRKNLQVLRGAGLSDLAKGTPVMTSLAELIPIGDALDAKLLRFEIEYQPGKTSRETFMAPLQ